MLFSRGHLAKGDTREHRRGASGDLVVRSVSFMIREGMTGRRPKNNPNWGSSLDDFLKEEGIREAARTEALTRVVVWQLSREMERRGMSKAEMAERMHTSRAQLDRILKAKSNVTIETLQRAAALFGRELRLELV
jgi:DNA-binding phage protein